MTGAGAFPRRHRGRRIAAALLPLLLLATWGFKRIAQRNWAQVAENRSRFTAHLVESVSGVRLLQQTGQQQANLRRYQGLLDDFNRALIIGSLRRDRSGGQQR